MNLLLCTLLISGGSLSDDLYQDPFDMPAFSIIPIVKVHVGGWSGGFEFEAVRASGLVEITGEGLAIVGVEAGVLLWERFTVLLGGEYGYGSDVTMETAMLTIGWQMPIDLWGQKWLPNRVHVYGGLMYSTIDVDISNFGTLDPDNFGFRAGIAPGWQLSETWALAIFAEFRIIRFEYKGTIISGDDRIGGAGFAGGVNLEFRF